MNEGIGGDFRYSHICFVKSNKSCLNFTACSVHFNWKLQLFFSIGKFFSFAEMLVGA